nr:DUF3313 family protein [Sphingomonas brevis]
MEVPVERRLIKVALAGLILVGFPAAAAKPPTTWDGLVQVKSKRLDHVYLQPGADFTGYTKVMIDEPEVAFEKNWARNYNNSSRSLSSRISDRDVQQAISKGVTAARDLFTEAWTKGGYAIVDAPGPDVLQIRTGILNVRVSAPDLPRAGRVESFSSEAGSATFFLEARDSMTGAILGRAVDSEFAGEYSHAWRTSVSNRDDFRDLVRSWADTSVRGLAELKSRSPIKP